MVSKSVLFRLCSGYFSYDYHDFYYDCPYLFDNSQLMHSQIHFFKDSTNSVVIKYSLDRSKQIVSLFLRYKRLAWNAEEMAFAKTSPRRRIPNLRRTCWSIVPMAQMRLIRYISDVKSSLSMIFMGIFRWVGLDKKTLLFLTKETIIYLCIYKYITK